MKKRTASCCPFFYGLGRFLQKHGKKLFSHAGNGGFSLQRRGQATAVAKVRSRFLLTKRRVQGGEATSERRRRDGVSGKSHQRKAPRPPLQTTSHPVELAAESNARQVCTIYSKIKKLLSISHHIISRTARANIAPAKSEQIRRGDWLQPWLLIHFPL